MPFRSATNQRTTGQRKQYVGGGSDDDYLSDDGDLSENDLQILNTNYTIHDQQPFQAPAFPLEFSRPGPQPRPHDQLARPTPDFFGGPGVPPRRTSLRHRESISRAETADSSPPTYHAPLRKAHAYQQPRRPLIDLIKNEWQQAALGSHAPTATYEHDTPLWLQICFAPRFQRGVFGILTFFFVVLGAWKIWVAPHLHEGYGLKQSALARIRNDEGWFGQNLRPDFVDMAHLDTLEETLVPGSAGVDPQRRLIVIGDVHGCNVELNKLLTTLTYRPKHDHLIFAGDMITKGPNSPAVVDLAISHKASCVRGNHEDRVLLTYRDLAAHPRTRTEEVPPPPGVPEEASLPQLNVADQKLVDDPKLDREVEEFSRLDVADRALARQLTKKHIDYLSNCPTILDIGTIPGLGKVHVVHAGMVPSVSLERQDPHSVMHMRTVDLDTHVPSSKSKGTPWYKLWNKYQSLLPKSKRATIIYGHDSKRGLKIKRYTKGLDTGCVSGGQLTALIIDQDVVKGAKDMQVVSVPCKDYRSLERKIVKEAAQEKEAASGQEGGHEEAKAGKRSFFQ